MNIISSIVLSLVFLKILSFNAVAQDLKVAAAANLQGTIQEIAAAFEAQNGVKVTLIMGSSGKLTAQIQNGAPFDLFLSADMKYPQALYKEGLSLQEPKTYAYGVLVLWTTKNMDLSKGMDILKDPKIKKIALANPQTAPYGREAVHVLKSYRLYSDVQGKLVYGESINQTNDFIVSQSADIGFTSKSTVFSGNLKEKGIWVEVPAESYQRMPQGAVILKYAQKTNGLVAQQFYDFLFSPEVKEIFKKYGYTVDE